MSCASNDYDPKRRRLAESSPGTKGKTLRNIAIDLVVVILRYFYLLDVPMNGFTPTMTPKKSLRGGTASTRTLMTQRDYLGYFTRDITRTIFVLFRSVRLRFAHCNIPPPRWVPSAPIGFYIPKTAICFDLTLTKELGAPQGHESSILRYVLSRDTPSVKTLFLSIYATHSHRLHKRTTMLMGMSAKGVRRLVLHLCGSACSPTCPTCPPSCYIRTLQSLSPQCKVQMVYAHNEHPCEYWTNFTKCMHCAAAVQECPGWRCATSRFASLRKRILKVSDRVVCERVKKIELLCRPYSSIYYSKGWWW